MGKKILVVDDEIHIIKIVKYKLEKEGYQIISALSGSDAIRLTEEENPDLILLDIMMPDISGYQVCSYLKSNTATQNIPIIMLTAKIKESDKIRGLELGVADYITKPFSPNYLLERTKKLIG